jgi:ABC-type amino acid transport substrate-binding protein
VKLSNLAKHTPPATGKAGCCQLHILFLLLWGAILPVCRAGTAPQPVRAAALENWPPQYLLDKESGAPTGFAVEVFERIAARSGLAVNWPFYQSWAELNEAAADRRFQVVPNIGVTEERPE